MQRTAGWKPALPGMLEVLQIGWPGPKNKTGGLRIPRNPPAKRPAAIDYDAFFEASRNAFT